MGKKTKKAFKPSSRSKASKKAVQENAVTDIVTDLGAEIISEAENIKQEIAVYQSEEESVKKEKISGKQFFVSVKKITDLYAKQRELILNYNNSVKDYLYPDGVFINYESLPLEKRAIKAEFQYIWKECLVPLIDYIDEELSARLRLFKYNAEEISQYIDEATGDGLFHLIAKANVPIFYCNKYLDFSSFNAIFVEKFFFALNKKYESAYVIFLNNQQNISLDAGAVRKSRGTVIRCDDLTPFDIEAKIKEKEFKIYTEAKELALLKKREFVPNFNFLLLFINRSESYNRLHYVYHMTSFLLLHGFVSVDGACKLKNSNAVLSNEQKKESLLKLYMQEPILKSSMLDLDMQRRSNDNYQQRCEILAKEQNVQAISKEDDDRIYEEELQKLQQSHNEESLRFLGELGTKFYKYLLDVLNVDHSLYKDISLQYLCNVDANSIVYTHPLHLMLVESFYLLVRQGEIDIVPYTERIHVTLLTAVVNFLMEHDYGLASVATKDAFAITHKQYFASDILACSLARFSRLFDGHQKKEKGRVRAGYQRAHQGVIDSFNLFWNELSVQGKKDLLAYKDPFGHNLVSTSIQVGSYDFLVNLCKNIKALEISEAELISGLKISPLFLTIAEFDLARFRFLLDADMGFSLKGKFVIKLEGGYKSLDYMGFCLHVLQKDVYKRKKQEVDSFVAYINEKMPSYDRGFVADELKAKGLTKTRLAEILRDVPDLRLSQKTATDTVAVERSLDDWVEFIGEDNSSDNKKSQPNLGKSDQLDSEEKVVSDRSFYREEQARELPSEMEGKEGDVFSRDEIESMWQILGFALDGDAHSAAYFLKLFAQYKADLKQQDLQNYISEIAITRVNLSSDIYRSILQAIFSIKSVDYEFCIRDSNLILNKALHDDQRFFEIFLDDARFTSLFFVENNDVMIRLIKTASIELLFFLYEKMPILADFRDREGNGLEEMVRLFRSKEDFAIFSKLFPQKEPNSAAEKISVLKSDSSVSDSESLEAQLVLTLPQMRMQEHKTINEDHVIPDESKKAVMQKKEESRPANNNVAVDIKLAISKRFKSSNKLVKILQKLVPKSEIYYHGSSVYSSFIASRLEEEKFSALKRRKTRDLNIRVCLAPEEFSVLAPLGFLNKVQKKSNLLAGHTYEKGMVSFSFDLYDGVEKYQITLIDKQFLARLPFITDVESLYLDISSENPQLRTSFPVDEPDKFMDNIAAIGICQIYNFQAIEKLFFGPLRCSKGMLLGNEEIIKGVLTRAFVDPYYGNYLAGRFMSESAGLANYEMDLIDSAALEARGASLFDASRNNQYLI